MGPRRKNVFNYSPAPFERLAFKKCDEYVNAVVVSRQLGD